MRTADETRKELHRLALEMDEAEERLRDLEQEYKHVQSQCRHEWGQWKKSTAGGYRWRECSVCYSDQVGED